ncbi:hypothetical protein J2Z23_000773 [Lederbergia galactosidilyticus]|uniref:spore germination protein n=1 Tax=Lederbergia galactosidilytica TaxID=217031 RepID=UPI001AE9374E|nr:hypothetical protein [Lederbergia galactosidilytica]
MEFFKQTKNNTENPPVGNSNKLRETFSNDMTANVNLMKTEFHYPTNTALKIRELDLPSYNKKSTLLFVEGTINIDTLETHILKPLLQEGHTSTNVVISSLPKEITENVLTSANTKIITKTKIAAKELLNGNSLLLFENESEAICVETAGFEGRPVSQRCVVNC